MKKEIQELTQDVRVSGFFDFGRDAFSTLEVELETPFPENIEIVVGEVAQDGHLVHAPGFRTFIQQILQTGVGRQVIRFHIPKHIPAYGGFPHCLAPAEAGGEVAPFRYVEVNRHYGKVTCRRTAWFGDWDDSAADFHCANPLLNQVWEFCKYSIKATSVFDKYVDGERERMPYEGDAVINQLGHFCCDANYAQARRTIDHFLAFGQFTWPAEWMLLTPVLVRDYWLYSGDDESLQRWLPLLDSKLMPGCLDAGGLLNQSLYQTAFPDRKVRDIVDWPESERDGYEFGEVNFVPNAYLYHAYLVMHQLTRNPEYQAKAARLRNALRSRLLRDGRFVDSEGSARTSLHTALFALRYGLTEGEEEVHREILLTRGMACSVYGAQFLLETCFQQGMAEHALALLTSDGPRSWLNMMRTGATISMESWGDQWKTNQDWNHAWGAAPANLIPRWLCGIRPVESGFRRFVVAPQPASLAQFALRQPTKYGPITLEWDRGRGLLVVPEGTTAVFLGKKLLPGKHPL
ncbi:MAG: hypothetical protein IJJ33_18555 [Victivallales bacterium]|nr:hypothetical protein [Victivallales bacterium]